MTDYTDLIARLVSAKKVLDNQGMSNLAKSCGLIAAADALEAQARRIAHLEYESAFRLDDASKAWDLCEAKSARIAELEAALRPFTDVESIVPFFHDAGWGLYAHVVTKRDMEAAREALEKKK